MTPEEFRRLGHQIIDWIADYRATVSERPSWRAPRPARSKPPCPPTRPNRPNRSTPSSPISTASSCPASPTGSIPISSATFPPTASSPASSATIAQHRPRRARPLLAVEPRAHRNRRSGHRLDAADDRPLRRMERRDPGHGFHLHAGRSALRPRARHQLRLNRGGLQAEAQPLVVYASAHSHSSVDKAALLAGFGRDNVRHILDARRALRHAAATPWKPPSSADLATGRKPCAVVATTGTTATTALDPVAAMARDRRGSTASGCTSTPPWPARP